MRILYLFAIFVTLLSLIASQNIAPLAFCESKGSLYQFCTGHGDVTVRDSQDDLGWCCLHSKAGAYSGNTTCGDEEWCTPSQWENKTSLTKVEQSLYYSFYPSFYQSNRTELCGTNTDFIMASEDMRRLSVNLTYSNGVCVYLILAAQKFFTPDSEISVLIQESNQIETYLMTGTSRYNASLLNNTYDQIQSNVSYSIPISQGGFIILAKLKPGQPTSTLNLTYQISKAIRVTPVDDEYERQIKRPLEKLGLSKSVIMKILLLIDILIFCLSIWVIFCVCKCIKKAVEKSNSKRIRPGQSWFQYDVRETERDLGNNVQTDPQDNNDPEAELKSDRGDRKDIDYVDFETDLRATQDKQKASISLFNVAGNPDVTDENEKAVANFDLQKRIQERIAARFQGEYNTQTKQEVVKYAIPHLKLSIEPKSVPAAVGVQNENQGLQQDSLMGNQLNQVEVSNIKVIPDDNQQNQTNSMRVQIDKMQNNSNSMNPQQEQNFTNTVQMIDNGLQKQQEINATQKRQEGDVNLLDPYQARLQQIAGTQAQMERQMSNQLFKGQPVIQQVSNEQSLFPSQKNTQIDSRIANMIRNASLQKQELRDALQGQEGAAPTFSYKNSQGNNAQALIDKQAQNALINRIQSRIQSKKQDQNKQQN